MDDMHVPEGKLKGKYKRIGAKVGRVVIIMQAISIAVVMLVCVFMYNSLVTKMQTDRCTNGTNMLAYELDKLSEGDDPNQLLDELKKDNTIDAYVYYIEEDDFGLQYHRFTKETFSAMQTCHTSNS